MTYDVRNPGTGLRQSQKYGRVIPIFISITGTL